MCGLCLVVAAALFAYAHATHPFVPAAATPTSGWWAFWDQQHYLEAAQAIARLDFSAQWQSYEPGYPALAAPFIHLPWADPFYIPDLALLLLACWLFGGIGERLIGSQPWARPASMALFVLTTVGNRDAAASWVDPWSTTPVVALLLGTALAGLALLDRLRPHACFAAAFCACAVAAFRPGDVLIGALPCAAAIAWSLLRQPAPPRAKAVAALASLAGAAWGLLPAVAAHAAIWGLVASPYMLLSQAIGFNLLLLPMRWVLIVLGPLPLTEGRGLAEAFPWIVSGVAGAAACLVVPQGRSRAPHALLTGIAGASLILFLSYRGPASRRPVALPEYPLLQLAATAGRALQPAAGAGAAGRPAAGVGWH